MHPTDSGDGLANGTIRFRFMVNNAVSQQVSNGFPDTTYPPVDESLLHNHKPQHSMIHIIMSA